MSATRGEGMIYREMTIQYAVQDMEADEALFVAVADLVHDFPGVIDPSCAGGPPVVSPPLCLKETP